MKIKIENLDEETTLKKFVEDWDLDINEINEELEESSCYSNDFVEIEREDDEITIRILTDNWEVMDMVNDIYDDYYLFVVKDVYYGENDEECEVCNGEGVDTNDEDCKSCKGEGGDYGELNYTSFEIENPTPETSNIIFQGGQNDEKSILKEDELSKFHKQRDEEIIDYTELMKYQNIWFVKKKDLISNGWGKTIESFNLIDWESYPAEIITDGLRESFFDNGNLSKTREYKDGKRNGIWKEFNVDGNLISEICYLKGEKEGESISYYKNGNKKEKSNFKRDKLNGKKIEWDEKGDIKSETIYKNDVAVTHRGFENGKLSYEGDVFENKFDGLFKYFYKSGKVKSEGLYKKNKMEGDWKGYYESGNLKKIVVFNDDIVISQRCWDEDGNEIAC